MDENRIDLSSVTALDASTLLAGPIATGLLADGILAPAVTCRAVPLADSADTFRRLLAGASDAILKEVVVP